MSCVHISGPTILEGGTAKAKAPRKETWPRVPRTAQCGRGENEARSGRGR